MLCHITAMRKSTQILGKKRKIRTKQSTGLFIFIGKRRHIRCMKKQKYVCYALDKLLNGNFDIVLIHTHSHTILPQPKQRKKVSLSSRIGNYSRAIDINYCSFLFLLRIKLINEISISLPLATAKRLLRKERDANKWR